MTETQTYGRGPQKDILYTFPIAVSARQQRQANDLFYGILEQIQAETEDADTRTRQRMFAWPDFERAVLDRLRRGHVWEQIIHDTPWSTMNDAFLNGDRTFDEVRNAYETMHGKPFVPETPVPVPPIELEEEFVFTF